MRKACDAIGIARATMQRRVKPRTRVVGKTRAKSERALTDEERAAILAVAHTERFADFAVREIYATLLDEGTYLCSISTMYRVLRDAGETRERRRLATHPAAIKPELAATAPNQVWSWDITKLLGPQKWLYYHLYVVLDVFSRYVVGFRLEARESAALATELFTETIAKERVNPRLLTVHSDGGPAMTSKTLTQLFADLGVVKSRSRPHVSNDNPFSEAQNKTMKYSPGYPGAFANIEQAREWCRRFVAWYNTQHHHSGIALLTPEDVHRGRVEERRDHRRQVLHKAYAENPKRFVKGKPEPPALATTVFINEPETIAA